MHKRWCACACFARNLEPKFKHSNLWKILFLSFFSIYSLTGSLHKSSERDIWMFQRSVSRHIRSYTNELKWAWSVTSLFKIRQINFNSIHLIFYLFLIPILEIECIFNVLTLRSVGKEALFKMSISCLLEWFQNF